MPRGKKKAVEAQEVKLVRRERKSGEMSARKRGRPHPDFENGYVDEAGKFQPGNPPKARGRRRGRRGARTQPTVAGGARKLKAGLGEIEQIIRREVETRLKDAKNAALAAFNKALDV